MNEEVLVSAQGVSKRFCRDLKRSLLYGVCDVAAELVGKERLGTGLRKSEFWANDDISFELRRGECLGLIGRNGAGKTTLLKMLNGLIKPDRGSITMRGKVGALIALGAGFNPILTGRENIFVNGLVLGLSKKEVAKRLDEIIEFAEISEFIDSPVQSYSSGMQVRLGFAVATALEPDVLILDEVLAVGDAAFRAKCYRRISQMRKNAAVIFVSHNMHQVGRICDRVLTLAGGKAVYNGLPEEGIEIYERLNSDTGTPKDALNVFNPPLTRFEARLKQEEFESGAPFDFILDWESTGDLDGFCIRLMIISSLGHNVADASFESEHFSIRVHPGQGCWTLGLDTLPLKNGTYHIGITLVGNDGEIVAWSFKQVTFRVVRGSELALADCHLPATRWEGLHGTP